MSEKCTKCGYDDFRDNRCKACGQSLAWRAEAEARLRSPIFAVGAPCDRLSIATKVLSGMMATQSYENGFGGMDNPVYLTSAVQVAYALADELIKQSGAGL